MMSNHNRTVDLEEVDQILEALFTRLRRACCRHPGGMHPGGGHPVGDCDIPDDSDGDIQ